MSWLERFNEIKLESGLTLDELSEKSGVPKSTVAKIASGHIKKPNLETMRDLVYAMGHTLDDVMGNAKGPPPEGSEPDELTETIMQLFPRLSPEGLEKALSYIRFLIENEGSQ